MRGQDLNPNSHLMKRAPAYDDQHYSINDNQGFGNNPGHYDAPYMNSKKRSEDLSGHNYRQNQMRNNFPGFDYQAGHNLELNIPGDPGMIGSDTERKMNDRNKFGALQPMGGYKGSQFNQSHPMQQNQNDMQNQNMNMGMDLPRHTHMTFKDLKEDVR